MWNSEGPHLIKMSAPPNESEEAAAVSDFSIKCGHCLRSLEKEKDKGILCQCNCGCRKWYHWSCVYYDPTEYEDLDCQWYCPTCSVSSYYDAFNNGNYCNDEARQLSQLGVIIGLLPLVNKAVYSTKAHLVTVVGSSTINNLTTLYIGTDNGYVLQVFYDPMKRESIEFGEIKVDKSEIRAVRNVNGETFFMSQNKIVRLLQETQCGRYSDNCQQCMDVRDVNCGWCVTSNRCTSKMECASGSPDYWLPSVKNQCLSLEFKEFLSGYAYKLDQTIGWEGVIRVII
uniref:Plexin-B2 n=1 Tax=Magallana gigas TaxID=29159 RepID=K1Q1Q5_MAGGI